MFRSSSTFKVVNSWGDWWGTNGTYEIPYSVITTPMRDPSGKLVPPHIGSVRYVENRPTSLSLADPFTARIRLRHNQNRNLVKVSVSVGAEQPKVLWGHGTVFGSSTNLCIDVPLPRYARQYWPPNASHTWRVLVQELTPTASSSARQVGTVEEITLVQRLVDAQGRCLPVVAAPEWWTRASMTCRRTMEATFASPVVNTYTTSQQNLWRRAHIGPISQSGRRSRGAGLSD
jgi:hypothetical protein